MGLKQKNIQERIEKGINLILCKHIERYNNTSSGSNCNSCTKDLIKLFSEALAIQRKEIGEMIEGINYNSQAEGCGLEDRGITNRYEASEYGWENAKFRILEALEILE